MNMLDQPLSAVMLQLSVIIGDNAKLDEWDMRTPSLAMRVVKAAPSAACVQVKFEAEGQVREAAYAVVAEAAGSDFLMLMKVAPRAPESGFATSRMTKAQAADLASLLNREGEPCEAYVDYTTLRL